MCELIMSPRDPLPRARLVTPANFAKVGQVASSRTTPLWQTETSNRVPIRPEWLSKQLGRAFLNIYQLISIHAEREGPTF